MGKVYIKNSRFVTAIDDIEIIGSKNGNAVTVLGGFSLSGFNVGDKIDFTGVDSADFSNSLKNGQLRALIDNGAILEVEESDITVKKELAEKLVGKQVEEKVEKPQLQNVDLSSLGEQLNKLISILESIEKELKKFC